MREPHLLDASALAACLRTLEAEGCPSPAAIKKRYRALVLKHHPDRNHTSSTARKKGEEKLKNINPAYEKLIDHFAALAAKVESQSDDQAAHGRNQQENEAAAKQREDERRAREAARRRRQEERKRNAERRRAQRAKKERVQRVVTKVLTLARLNIAEAQYMLGLMYETGHLVKRHDRKAFEWYQLAAKQGHSVAQVKSGYYCERAGDWKGATSWYGMMLGQSEDVADICDVSDAVPPEMEDAYDELVLSLSALVKQGDLECQSLYNDMVGMKPASADFCYLVGRIFGAGLVVARDEVMEAKWYQRAAALGNAEAHADLAFCFEWGKGVEPNDRQAIRLYELAVLQGIGRAAEPLRLLKAAYDNPTYGDFMRLRRELLDRGLAVRWRDDQMDLD